MFQKCNDDNIIYRGFENLSNFLDFNFCFSINGPNNLHQTHQNHERHTTKRPFIFAGFWSLSMLTSMTKIFEMLTKTFFSFSVVLYDIPFLSVVNWVGSGFGTFCSLYYGLRMRTGQTFIKYQLSIIHCFIILLPDTVLSNRVLRSIESFSLVARSSTGVRCCAIYITRQRQATALERESARKQRVSSKLRVSLGWLWHKVVADRRNTWKAYIFLRLSKRTWT